MKSKISLDGIVTLVDAKHVWQHIDTSSEVKEQVAFADVILLNKIDLVPADEVDKLEARIKGMNAAAKIYRTKDALVDLDHVLNVGGFNLDRALEVDPKFLEPEYPFEWSSIYQFDAGRYEFVLQPGPDPTMNLTLLPLKDASQEALEAVKMEAVLTFSDEEFELYCGESLKPGKQLTTLKSRRAIRIPPCISGMKSPARIYRCGAIRPKCANWRGARTANIWQRVAAKRSRFGIARPTLKEPSRLRCT